MIANDNFLNSTSEINQFSAEFQILQNIASMHKNKLIIIVFPDIKEITFYAASLNEYISQKYVHGNSNIFFISDTGKISGSIGCCNMHSKSDALNNEALKYGKNAWILLHSKTDLILYNNSRMVTQFNNTINQDEKTKKIIDDNTYDIYSLEKAFEAYTFYSKKNNRYVQFSCEEKVKNDVNEKQLRNHLYEFLKIHMKSCTPSCERLTSLHQDEESVDICITDNNDNLAIIEVKFFVSAEKIHGNDKGKYTTKRFRDGYSQIDRYITHLINDNENIFSAYLYMFYASEKTDNEIKSIFKIDLDEMKQGKNLLTNEKKLSCNFSHYFKATILDNLLYS